MTDSPAPSYDNLHKTTIIETEILSDDIMAVRLEKPVNYRYEAGQYIQLTYKDLPTRPYSLASAPSVEGHLELHIKRDPQGVLSKFLFDDGKSGEDVHISDANGDNIYQNHDKKLICVAGGIGIVPVKSIIKEVLHHNSAAHIDLFWGVSQETDLYLNNFFFNLSEAHKNFRFDTIIENLVTDMLLDYAVPEAGAYVHLCGPPAMIDSTKDWFYGAGLDDTQIFFDPAKQKSRR